MTPFAIRVAPTSPYLTDLKINRDSEKLLHREVELQVRIVFNSPQVT
jgi:hypothetical protein